MSVGLSAVTGGWDYGSLPANVHLGQDCFLEMPESFQGCRSTLEPAVTLGDRVRVYGWTRFNLDPTGCVHVGDDSVVARDVPAEAHVAGNPGQILAR